MPDKSPVGLPQAPPQSAGDAPSAAAASTQAVDLSADTPDGLRPGPTLRAVCAGLLALNLMALLLCGWMLWRAWHAEVADAEQSAVTTVNLLERGAGATLDKVGIALGSVTQQMERQLAAGGIDRAVLWSVVDQAVAQVPELERIGVFDAAGQQVCGQPEQRCRRFQVGDRDYFQRLRDDPSLPQQWAGPVTSRPDNVPSALLVRALRLPDQRFAGVVVAALPLAGLQPLVGAARLGPNGVASLRTDAMALLAVSSAHPDHPRHGVGTPLSPTLLQHLARSPQAGVYRAVTPVDGVERVTAYRRLAHYPVYALVGEATEDFLRGWWRLLGWTVAFAVLFMAASLALARAVRQGLRRQELAQRLYDEAPCGYHTLGPDGRYRSINATELRWLGVTRAQAIGRLGPTDFMGESGRQAFAEHFPRLMQGQRIEDVGLEITGRHGQLRHVLVSAQRVTDAQGRFRFSNSVMYDVTALRRADAARAQAAELEVHNLALQEAVRLKDDFLSNLSHELRTPLNAVIGFSQLLQMGAGGADSAKRDRWVRQIGDSGQHLLALVQTMLDFARSASGRMVFAPRALSVTLALNEVAQMLEPKCLAAQVGLAVTVAPGLDRIDNDPLRLRQMLLNLAGNAVKFSRPGGLVRLHAEALDARRWRLTVEDQGIGIAADDLPRLFQPFVQLSAGPAKTAEGTGLGLALVRRIARAQGGDVQVRSVVGVGSVFTLELPRVLAAEGPGAP